MSASAVILRDFMLLALLLSCTLYKDVDCAKWKLLSFGDSDDAKFTKVASAFSSTLLYTFGGESEGHYSGDLKSFDPGKKRWTKITGTGDIPSHRAGATLTKIASGLYLIGGHNYHGTLGSIHKYDIITNKWHKVLLPDDFKFTSRSGHAACTDGQNRIFVFGGYNDEGLFLNDLYEISFSVSSDPTADSDSTEITASFKLLNADLNSSLVNPPPKEFASMEMVDGRLHLYGGHTYGGSSDGMWMFDLKDSRWTMVESQLSPPPCEGISSMTMGRSIFYFGGCDSSYSANRCFSDFWRYDTTSSKWSIIPTADVKPSGRAFAAMGFLNNGIVVHGGSKLDKRIFGETYHLVELPRCKDAEHTCLGRGKCYTSSCSCTAGYDGHDCSITVMSDAPARPSHGDIHTEM